MYLKMFGLNEKPFHITPNPRFIFLSKNHKEAFAHLLYGIQQRVGFLSLTGEVGTGKTTVLRTLLKQLEESEYRVALVFNPCLSDLELLQSIHREFGIDFDPEKSNLVSLHDSLNRFLLEQRESGCTVVLVVDEAQNLDPTVLEQLRLLSNLETETEKLIQIVLVGQPELEDILERNDLRQLRQRLAVRYQLQPMGAEDSTAYIQHRLRIAGRQGEDPFNDKALTRVYQLTGGTPRLINILCDRALLVAYSRDAKVVTLQDVNKAQKELQQKEIKRDNRYLPMVAVLVISVLIGFAASQFLNRMLQPGPTRVAITPASTQEAVAKTVPLEQLPAVAERSATPQALQPPPLTVERISYLQRQIIDLGVAESSLQAYLATTTLWGKGASGSLPAMLSRAALKMRLNKNGFDTVDFQGSLDELLTMNVPAILEIVLPNVDGKRYLALVETAAGRVRTVPELTESGWLTDQELTRIWFGKAIVPFVNRDRIRLIDRPGQQGGDVIALQRLLGKLAGVGPLESGRYDRQTIAAVTEFQMRHQLAPDGRVGSQTLFWLYRKTGSEMPRVGAGEAL